MDLLICIVLFICLYITETYTMHQSQDDNYLSSGLSSGYFLDYYHQLSILITQHTFHFVSCIEHISPTSCCATYNFETE